MTDLPLMEPATEEKPTPRRSRTRWIVLGALAAVLVVLAAIIGPIGWPTLHEERVPLTTPAKAAGLAPGPPHPAQATAGHLRPTIAAENTLNCSRGSAVRPPTPPQ